MATRPKRDVTAEFEAAAAALESVRYVLRLYVIGLTPRSLPAIERSSPCR